MKNALKELKVNDGYVQQCNVNGYDVLVLCFGVGEIVSVHGYCCEWLMSSFLGSWKNFVLANTVAPNTGGTELASWDELTKCMWCVFLLVFTKKVRISLFKEVLKFVTEGSLPWRFQQCLLKVVSHGDLNAVVFWCEGPEMSNLGDGWYSSLLGFHQNFWFGWNMYGSWNEYNTGVLKWVNFDEKL